MQLYGSMYHTEAEINLETEKNNGHDPQKDQINTLGERTQTTNFRLAYC